MPADGLRRGKRPDRGPGLGVDTAYGRLLRRMTDDNVQVRYAVVGPRRAAKAALRVPAKVRQDLRIDLYEVTDDDTVQSGCCRCGGVVFV